MGSVNSEYSDCRAVTGWTARRAGSCGVGLGQAVVADLDLGHECGHDAHDGLDRIERAWEICGYEP